MLRHAKVLRQTQGTVVVPVFKRNSAISVRESENSWFQVVWFQYFVDIHGSLRCVHELSDIPPFPGGS